MRLGSAARWSAIVLAALVSTGIVVAWAASGENPVSGRVPRPAILTPTGKHCIQPADVMRREHMNMLVHQRDRTVRDGVRGSPVSLESCVACHAGPGTGAAGGAVTGSPEAFCESCHQYAAVKLDCFECHQGRVSASANAGARR